MLCVLSVALYSIPPLVSRALLVCEFGALRVIYFKPVIYCDIQATV